MPIHESSSAISRIQKRSVMADDSSSTGTLLPIHTRKQEQLKEPGIHDVQKEPSLATPLATPRDDTPPPEDLSHKQAMEIVHERLGEILEGDPLLSDLPAGVTAEEVSLQIALEYGQAMTVCVQKFTGEIMRIVVLQGARVQDLRHAIQRYVTLKEERTGLQTSISWKYVWRTYSLCFDGEQLEQNKKLKEYGIKNKDTVTFVKRLL